MTSQIRQNYAVECEAAINKQINLELYASYVYLSMAYYYDRDDVALPGMKNFCQDNSDEEREHARLLMKLQNMRGGRLMLQDIAAPAVQEWGTVLNGLEAALDLEKKVNQSLLDLHKLAADHVDPYLTKEIEDHFLSEQVESIKKLGDNITRIKLAGPDGLGEFLFDKQLS